MLHSYELYMYNNVCSVESTLLHTLCDRVIWLHYYSRVEHKKETKRNSIVHTYPCS